MSVDLKGIGVAERDGWSALIKQHLSHRWRQKLAATFLFVPVSLAVFYFVVDWMVERKLFVDFIVAGYMEYAAAFYIGGGLFILWFSPVRADVSDSFLEIDLRRKSEPRNFKPVSICSNRDAVAVLVAEGQVKYYPIQEMPKDVKLEDYVNSQKSEVDRLSVSQRDMSELARLIDRTGLLKTKKNSVVSVAEREDDALPRPAEVVEKPQYASAFVRSIESVIKSLDFQIETAEQKASNLLDVGRKYLKNGIYCYAVSIAVWQFVLYGLEYNWNWGLGAGVISCAVAFVVVEFLAAWFLKQYRHYGDSVQTYMMVRSVYERHLLSYYAIEEFSELDKDNEVCRAALLKVLSEEIKWPELKDVNANDFNYMVKSFESVSSLLEKVKVGANKSGQKTEP